MPEENEKAGLPRIKGVCADCRFCLKSAFDKSRICTQDIPSDEFYNYKIITAPDKEYCSLFKEILRNRVCRDCIYYDGSANKCAGGKDTTADGWCREFEPKKN